MVPLMQAILSVFSCCQATNDVVDHLTSVTFDIVDQLPNSHLLTMPIVTASMSSHTSHTHTHTHRHTHTRTYSGTPCVLIREVSWSQGSNITHYFVCIWDKVQDVLNDLEVSSFRGSTVHNFSQPLLKKNCLFILSGSRAIHSIQCMIRIIEHCIERHFIAVPKPQPYSEFLPKEPLCMYGWKSVIQSLAIPEEIIEEFCSSGISEFACLTLNAHLLQMLPQCTSMSQESRICAKLVNWCTNVKPPYAIFFRILPFFYIEIWVDLNPIINLASHVYSVSLVSYLLNRVVELFH